MHAEFVHGRTYMLACMHAGMRAFSMYVYAAVLDSCMPIGTAVNVELAHLTQEHLSAPDRVRVGHTAALPKPPAVPHGTLQAGAQLKSDSR